MPTQMKGRMGFLLSKFQKASIINCYDYGAVHVKLHQNLYGIMSTYGSHQEVLFGVQGISKNFIHAYRVYTIPS